MHAPTPEFLLTYRAMMLDGLQREVDKKYALQFIAVLGLAAACCAGLVGTVIWIVGGI